MCMCVHTCVRVCTCVSVVVSTTCASFDLINSLAGTKYHITACIFCFYSYNLAKDVKKAGLNSHVVCDAGRTQIAPGSQTVLCIGPGKKALFKCNVLTNIFNPNIICTV